MSGRIKVHAPGNFWVWSIEVLGARRAPPEQSTLRWITPIPRQELAEALRAPEELRAACRRAEEEVMTGGTCLEFI